MNRSSLTPSFQTPWFATVTNVTDDPNKSGRVQVRIHGLHDDTANIPDADLPWAIVLGGTNNPSIGGMGSLAGIGLSRGTVVMINWAVDGGRQIPVVMGTLPRVGTVVSGSTTAGAPTIDRTSSSAPAAIVGIDRNTRSQSGQTPPPPINQVESGAASVANNTTNSGVTVTEEVKTKQKNTTLPTTASANKNDRSDVLDIARAVDPLGRLSSLPCLNSGLFSIRSLLGLLGGLARGLLSTVTQAIRNAILRIASRLGIYKVLGMLNKAVAAVNSIRNLMRALNLQVCGVNLINQKLFDSADFVAASVINGLNNSVGAIVGGIDKVINTATGAVTGAVSDATNSALNALVNSVPSPPAANQITENSPRPPSEQIGTTAPTGFVQQYFSNTNDPFPGYIEWRDPTGQNPSVYTLRGSEPNYTSAQQHTEFAAQEHFGAGVAQSMLNGTFNLKNLMDGISSTTGFAQVFSLTKALGIKPGFAISGLALMLPSLSRQMTTAKNKTEDSVTRAETNEALEKHAEAQNALARQRLAAQAALDARLINAEAQRLANV